MGANLLLRPLVQTISGQSIENTKSETRYCCRVICHIGDEADVRALLLHPVKNRTLLLDGLYSKNLDSEDNQPQVEIKADFVTTDRNDALLEQVVSLMKSKVEVSEVSWEFVSQETE